MPYRKTAKRQEAIDRFHATCAQMLSVLPPDSHVEFHAHCSSLFDDSRMTTRTIDCMCAIMRIVIKYYTEC